MRNLIAPAVLLMFSAIVNAEPSSEKMLQHLSDELNLSASQQTQIAPVLESFHEQMSALRDSGYDRREQREQMQQLKEARDQQLQDLLSDEQFQQLQTLEQQRRPRRGDRHE